MGNKANSLGQPFNPWRGECAFYPPDVVGRCRSLTDGPKRLYERLVRYAGRNGVCWPAKARLAEDLGKSLAQVKRDLAALEKAQLISHRFRDKRRTNVYEFLWHNLFEGSPTTSQPEFEGSSTTPQMVRKAPIESSAEPSRRVISESLRGRRRPPNSVQEFNTGKSVQASDTPKSGETKPDKDQPASPPLPAADPENPDPEPPANQEELEALREALLAVTGKRLKPEDRLPAELLKAAAGVGATAEELLAWLPNEANRKRRRGDPINGPGYFLAVIDEEFPAWLHRTRPARTEEQETKWEPAEFEHEKAEQERIKSECVEAVRNSPVKLAEAVELVHSGALVSGSNGNTGATHWGSRISPGLVAELEDEGISQISPVELLARHRDWKRCPKCGDSGTREIRDEIPRPQRLISWCPDNCRTAKRLREKNPDCVDNWNREAEELRLKFEARCPGKPRAQPSKPRPDPVDFKRITADDFAPFAVKRTAPEALPK